MNSTAQSNLDEFVRYLNVPVTRDETAIEWQNDNYRYLIEWHDTYLLLSIMLTELPSEIDATLSVLYQRASPERLMGLPIRIYRSKESIVGVVAIPEEAVMARRLLRLQQNMQRLFDLSNSF